MIQFCCDYCAHKISVRDKDAGKQGKCPKCGNVITIPAESTIIEFLCDYCDRRISVPKSHAGKKAICPQCNNSFIIPTINAHGSEANQDYSEDLISRSTDSPHGLTLLDVPEEYKLKDEPVVQSETSEQIVDRQQESEKDSDAKKADSASLRKLPWILDIFLYPFNLPGLKHVAIFTGIPLLIAIAMRIIPGFFYMLLFYISWVAYGVLIIYMCWYISVCIRDSANGWVRAPEGLGAVPDFIDMFEQTVNIIGCLGVCFGPAVIYAFFTGRLDIFFLWLLGFALFVYPMGLLAVVAYDSPAGFKPGVIVYSISDTFLPYLCLVLLIFAICVLIAVIAAILPQSMLRPYIIIAISTYLTIVTAHILGFFYFKHREKLRWKVE